MDSRQRIASAHDKDDAIVRALAVIEFTHCGYVLSQTKQDVCPDQGCGEYVKSNINLCAEKHSRSWCLSLLATVGFFLNKHD
ncbi:hypothetical protein [Ereboglobus luteus]|uniref:hypothetical protein n=1 Tax=Ereboglobus luteus TaxID=1796921 RepID=UPI0012601AC3|nr:hypothetical protein [Ereboglobus luteus]